MIYRGFIHVILITCIATSCQQEANFEQIDAKLKAAIEKQSASGNLDHYLLPTSQDYSNIPQDPLNPLTDSKVELGKNLFHDTAFGTKGKFDNTLATFSCASCHHADAGFQAGIAQGIGEGGLGFGNRGEGRIRNSLCEASLCDVQPLRSPSILNTAYQELMLWSGQFGSSGDNVGTEAYWTEDTPKAVNKLGFQGLETQAIAGIGVHRLNYDEAAVDSLGYKELFDQAFSDTPQEERYNIEKAGLAMAAYERTVLANEAPFQKYLAGDNSALTDQEKHGALLFFSEANCVSCHNGPGLNSMEFHALGLKEFKVAEVTHYDTEDPAKLGRYAFTQNEADLYKFKVPQLYNLKNLSFYGHGASINTIEHMIHYKNRAIAENTGVPKENLSDQFIPLNLTDVEIKNLSLFIENGLYDPNLERYVPSSLPSGNCFPNNDELSQEDLGCN